MVLQLFNREAAQPAGNSRQSTASTWTRTRTPSRPTAGSTRWWSSFRCWRWRGILTYGGFRIAGGASDAGRGGGVPAIRPAILPADSGFEREVQHPAIGHGVVGAHFQTARYRSPRCCRRQSPRRARRRRSRRSSSTTSGSRTRTRTGCCATSASASRPARPSRWWATPARARPRSSACCCASTTCSAAASGLAASTCASSIRWNCGAMFGVVLQDPYLFTGTLAENIRLGTEGIRAEDGGSGGRAGESAGFHPQLAGGLRAPDPRARQRTFHRPEAVDQFRARAGAQSALPDSGRSHVERGHGNRIPRARSAGTDGGRPHVAS